MSSNPKKESVQTYLRLIKEFIDDYGGQYSFSLRYEKYQWLVVVFGVTTIKEKYLIDALYYLWLNIELLKNSPKISYKK